MDKSDATTGGRKPVVHVDISNLSSTEGSRALTEALTEVAGRGEPFATVVRMPSTTERPKAISGAAEKVRMLKRLRPQLKQSCRGLAFVLTAEAQAANAKSIKAGAKLWGCPTFATDDPEAATAWAEAQLPGESTKDES